MLYYSKDFLTKTKLLHRTTVPETAEQPQLLTLFPDSSDNTPKMPLQETQIEC